MKLAHAQRKGTFQICDNCSIVRRFGHIVYAVEMSFESGIGAKCSFAVNANTLENTTWFISMSSKAEYSLSMLAVFCYKNGI